MWYTNADFDDSRMIKCNYFKIQYDGRPLF